LCAVNKFSFQNIPSHSSFSDFSEGGVAPLRVLELLPGFWNCYQGLGVSPRVFEKR